MSEEMTDAEKVSISYLVEASLTPSQMRAKRIAAMQRSMAQSQTPPASLQSETSSSETQQQHRPESALNRLMAASASPAPSIAVSKSPVPTPAPRTVAPSSARASPVPAVVRAPPVPVAVKKVSYDEWECDKIGEILGVSLTVRCSHHFC